MNNLHHSRIQSSRVTHRHAVQEDRNVDQVTATRNAIPSVPNNPAAQRHQRIHKATSYSRSKDRNSAPGHEFEDWLVAEAKVDRFF